MSESELEKLIAVGSGLVYNALADVAFPPYDHTARVHWEMRTPEANQVIIDALKPFGIELDIKTGRASSNAIIEKRIKRAMSRVNCPEKEYDRVKHDVDAFAHRAVKRFKSQSDRLAILQRISDACKEVGYASDTINVRIKKDELVLFTSVVNTETKFYVEATTQVVDDEMDMRLRVRVV